VWFKSRQCVLRWINPLLRAPAGNRRTEIQLSLTQIKELSFAGMHLQPMQISFAIDRLTDEQASQAFPLVQGAKPGIELPAWREFVRFHNSQLPAGHSGVLAMRDGGDCICGIFAYRVEQDLMSGPILSIQLFVAADILNSLSTVRALIDAAEVSAFKLGCGAVQIRTSSNQRVMGSHLQTLGLARDAYVSCRKIEPSQLSQLS
jgi:hypothetical protein